MKKLLALVLVLMLALPAFATAEDKITLTAWHRWSGTNEAVFQELVDAFEAKNPNIEIEVVAKAGQYMDLLQSMMADAAAGNEKPDMFTGGYELINYIYDELGAIPVNELAPSQEELDALYAAIDPATLSTGQYNGVQVGIPLALSNLVMYVNMDIMKEVGLTEADIPTTWEEVMKVSEIVTTKTGHYGIAFPLNNRWGDSILAACAGGRMISEDGTKMDLTNEGMVKAMTLWQELFTKGYHPKGTDTENTADWTAGNVALYCRTIMNMNSNKQNCDFELKIVEAPGFEGFTKVMPIGGAALMSFSKDEAKQNAVFEFLKFMVSQEGMETFTKTGYLCISNAEVPVIDGQEAAYAQMQYNAPYAYMPGGSVGLEIDSLWLNVRNNILYDGADVVQTLTNFENECNMMLENQ